jgi:hypothetical protein
VEIKDINIVNHTLCVAIVIECDILRPGRKNTTDGMYVFRCERARARARAAGENNKFQIVLTQKVEICCRGAATKSYWRFVPNELCAGRN